MLMLRGTGQSKEDFRQQVINALHAFYNEFQEQQEYVSYFQKHWEHKIGNFCPCAHFHIVQPILGCYVSLLMLLHQTVYQVSPYK